MAACMRFCLFLLVFLLLDHPVLAADAYTQSIEQWRAERIASLKKST